MNTLPKAIAATPFLPITARSRKALPPSAFTTIPCVASH